MRAKERGVKREVDNLSVVECQRSPLADAAFVCRRLAREVGPYEEIGAGYVALTEELNSLGYAVTVRRSQVYLDCATPMQRLAS